MALIGTTLVQNFLKGKGFYKGRIDGDFGNKSNKASREFLAAQGVVVAGWNDDRTRLGVEQAMMAMAGFYKGKVDGITGRQTRAALRLFQNATQDAKAPSTAGGSIWPRNNTQKMINFFGKPGTNQVKLTLPYKMKIAWDLDKSLTRFSCNAKVKEPFERIFVGTLEHYGMDAIQEMGLDLFGGCLNVRKIRGGRSWSTHAFGAAIDLDPARNRFRWGRDRANFANPEFDHFWSLVEGEGMVSLGRVANFDWMHFQAVRR